MKKLLMLLVVAGLAVVSVTEKANAQFKIPSDLSKRLRPPSHVSDRLSTPSHVSDRLSVPSHVADRIKVDPNRLSVRGLENAPTKFRNAQKYRTPYLSNGGHFIAGSSGSVLERDRSGKVTFTFRRLRTDDNFIYLRDDSRQLEVALPKANGKAYIRVDGRDFSDFSPVTWHETEGMGL